ANIAAMYLELALPLAVAGLVDASAPARPRWAAPAWAASVVVLLEALLLTYSRGALLGLAAMALATMLIVRRNRRLRLAPGQPRGPHTYNLGYHWLYPTGKVAFFENPRIRLHAPVAPGAAQTVRATIRAPGKAGRYLLVWDMVQENITWFSLKRAAYVGYPVL